MAEHGTYDEGAFAGAHSASNVAASAGEASYSSASEPGNATPGGPAGSNNSSGSGNSAGSGNFAGSGRHFSPSVISGKRKRNRRISNILLIVGVILLVAAAIGFGMTYMEYRDGADRYEKVREVSGVTQEKIEAVAQETADEDISLDVDWDALMAINSDVIGWIAIPGIDIINYPVVQGTDNDYYLTVSYDGDPGKYGSIFMDCDSKADLSDYHTIIYGHHLRNGEMFAPLVNYAGQTFYDEHQTVIYATPTKTHKLTVVGVYVEKASSDMRITSFESDEEFTEYVQSLFDKCVITSGVEASSIKHIYSLITCSYNQNDERTVVLCAEL